MTRWKLNNYTIRDPERIFNELSSFWNQFWQRDPGPEDHNYDDDQMFQRIRAALPDIIPMSDAIGETLEEWKYVLGQCKTHSAPGLDGFSVPELRMIPDSLLAHAIRLIAQSDTFPEMCMLAKTVPFPKKGQYTASSSRPITILTTLYRVWAKTCCTKITKHFAQIMPPEITGMLPQKGAFEASYVMQSTIECSRRRNEHVAGVTLDLRKCFNLIHRAKICRLMLLFGIQPDALSKWFNSLHLLSRVWVIDANISTTSSSTSGCPEGDPWSVMAMLVIAASWVVLLKHPPNPASPATSSHALSISAAAYADNWSWWQPHDVSHDHAVSTTLEFTTWMGLEVDWNKTWLWSTSSQGASLLRESLEGYIPGQHITYRWFADDLGWVSRDI